MKMAKAVRCRNGFMFEMDDEKVVCEIKEGTEHEDFARFLSTLSDLFGPIDSRHSDKRIYVIVAPGDKNEAFNSFKWPWR